MKSYVFLLGRPGAGKSVVYKLCEEKLKQINVKCIRVDDFLTLKEILQEDKEFKRHILKDGGFAVTDWSVVDEALQKLNVYIKKLQAEEPQRIIFIEFARDNYQHALKNFDSDVLSKSLILYIYCPYEECYRRNINRFKQPTTHDDHIVPLDLMETYYKTDDFELALSKTICKIEGAILINLKEISPVEIFVVDSSKLGIETLKPQMDTFVKKFFSYKN